MRPYYQDDAVTIYHGDCRDVLPGIGAVDIVLTDPPYGIGLRNNDVDGHRADRSFEITGDDSPEITQAILDSFGHVPVIAFASPWAPWRGRWRNLIVWDKGGAVGGGGDVTVCLKRSWELVQVARNGRINGARSESIVRFPIGARDTEQHIAAKPVPLVAWLLYKFSAPGDMVLDPFMGSGTTCVAAKDTHRRAIGIEIEERYCEVAAERCRQEVLAL